MRDAVDKVMQQVAEKKQQTRAEIEAERGKAAQKGRRRFAYLGLLALVFAVSLYFGVERWNHPFPPPTGAAAATGARRAIALAAGLVDRFVKANGRPPATLNEVGFAIPGLRYQRVGSQYILSMDIEGRPITFQSGDDLNRFKSGH
jgi:hypothetical protein